MIPLGRFFTAKTSYTISEERGRKRKKTVYRKVNKIYLLDCVSFSEAEEVAMKELKPFIPENAINPEAADIKPARFSEVYTYPEDQNGGGYYYEVKIQMTILTNGGKEKKSIIKWLVEAESISEARERVLSAMKGSMSDYEIVGLQLTKYEEVIPAATRREKTREESKA